MFSRCDPAARKLLLTTKPLLVKEEFTVVKDWDTAVPGAVPEGVVVKITDSGLLVQLWGELRGRVPKSQLSTETCRRRSSGWARQSNAG